MMDVWLEPYWTIEEITVWARCRVPDVVNLLQTPALDGRHAERNKYLDLRIGHAAMAARGRGRNIERELWEAWGHPTPLSSLIAPYFASDSRSTSGKSRRRRRQAQAAARTPQRWRRAISGLSRLDVARGRASMALAASQGRPSASSTSRRPSSTV